MNDQVRLDGGQSPHGIRVGHVEFVSTKRMH
jgi:hypothetical protein